MKLVFRADASIEIGAGHVMRCLTLAQHMRRRGHSCTFICGDQSGSLIDRISAQGFACRVLPVSKNAASQCAVAGDQYATWLGVPWEHDLELTCAILEEMTPDLLVVDHYSLDASWEKKVRKCVPKLMAIDDLANRRHDCDILLDQNLGKRQSHYLKLVPAGCEVLTGSKFALLRPEFFAARPDSISRRSGTNHELRKILIFMGGVDKPNYTGRALSILESASLFSHIGVTVILGESSPHRYAIESQIDEIGRNVKLYINADARQVARAMTESDLAIGAAGTSSWERCCLGLPTLLIILAENQQFAAAELARRGAALCLDDVSELEGFLVDNIKMYLSDPLKLRKLSENSSRVANGKGNDLVAETMERVCE